MRLVSSNWLHDGQRGRDNLLAAVAGLDADVVAAQEVYHDPDRIAAAEAALGMTGCITPNGNGNLCTGVYVRNDAVTSAPSPYAHYWPWHIPPTDVTVQFVADPKTPVTIISTHFAFHAPNHRVGEAEDLLRAVDKAVNGPGELIIAGDCNELPRRVHSGDVADIVWSGPDSTVTDVAHRGHRASYDFSSGAWSSRHGVDDTLCETGMVDVAVAAADRLEQVEALGATAGHDRPDQGGACRIDRAYVSPGLADRITRVQVVDTDVSDHHALVVDFAD